MDAKPVLEALDAMSDGESDGGEISGVSDMVLVRLSI